MSLDVSLLRKKTTFYEDTGESITEYEHVYDKNITHNLNKMANAAGIYRAMWRPEELFDGEIKAEQIIEILKNGLTWLKDNKVEAEKYNSPNGWGTYSNFVKFVKNYLSACKKYPKAIIKTYR